MECSSSVLKESGQDVSLVSTSGSAARSRGENVRVDESSEKFPASRSSCSIPVENEFSLAGFPWSSKFESFSVGSGDSPSVADSLLLYWNLVDQKVIPPGFENEFMLGKRLV